MSNEILSELLSEYDKKKLKAELDLDARKAELYKKLPRLQEIEDTLNSLAIETAKNILKAADVSEDIRTKDLTEEQEGRIRSEVAKIKVEGDLRREVALNIKRLQEIGCYRGIRHRRGLPVRGQKTKTNARTRKGPKKTVANKKK